jgi:hypothetical protein
VRTTAREVQRRFKESGQLVLKYLGVNGSEIHWAFIRAVLASVANLGYGASARRAGLGK